MREQVLTLRTQKRSELRRGVSVDNRTKRKSKSTSSTNEVTSEQHRQLAAMPVFKTAYNGYGVRRLNQATLTSSN
jgi:hypothetical protein